jgi:phosphatidylinositol alpha 1,6-mannosyltransferase
VTALRVAIVTGNYNAVIDGVGLILNRYVRALLESGAAVRVYAPVADRPAIVPHAGDLVPVPSVPIVQPYRLALGLTPGVRKDLIRFRPNLVHLSTPDWLGLSAQEWARRRKIPVASTFHTHFGSYLRYYRVGFLEPAYVRGIRWFYRRCRSVYVACPSMIDDLRRTGLDANFRELPLGVDTNRFTPARRNLEWRRRFGFEPDERVILYVGRLVREKGLAVFAETLNALKTRGVPHRILIVGEGPARDELQASLPHAVFAGRLIGDDLPAAFASSDLFFFPSASETFGLVSLEAMASGLPCVVANATGSRDLVRNAVDGYVCPPHESAGFYAAIQELLASPSLRDQFSRSAVARAQTYGWPRVLDRTIRLMRDDAGLP